MKDRLSDIWTRFGRRTSLDLTGTDIDHTPRPAFSRPEREGPAPSSRTAYRGERADGPTMPRLDKAPDPVRTALDAMHQRMAAEGKTGGRRQRHYEAGPVTPPETSVERTLFADLAVTRARTVRRDRNYISFASARQADWQRRRRRKFLGLF